MIRDEPKGQQRPASNTKAQPSASSGSVTLRPSVLHSLWDNAQEPPLPSPGSVEIIEEIEQGKPIEEIEQGMVIEEIEEGMVIEEIEEGKVIEEIEQGRS